MRVVQKLSLAFILSTSAVLAVAGGVRAQREAGVLEFDRLRDHHLIGRALGAALVAVWRSDGEARALSVLEKANLPTGRVRMRWVWLDGSLPDAQPAFEPSVILTTPTGESVTRVVKTAAGADMRYTYVPLSVDPLRRGALELSESMAGQQRFTHRMVWDTLVTTVILALVSAGLSTWLGVWIVGRPMRALAEKARRVGQGDFAGPLHLSQGDELGDLAREMNTMCDRLVLAHERVEDETVKKIAAQEQLRHADRLTTVGKLASGIAHELGTPLNVVSARAQMIAASETTPAETVDYAAVIVQATERMTRIIRQLLEFARRKGADRTTCGLEPIARRTVDMLAPLAAKRNVTLALVAERETLAFADASALEQVFTNLVVNAIHASNGGGTVTVRVDRQRATLPAFVSATRDELAAVSVTDTGSGIAEHDLAHVFEPFFTTKDVGEGTGLGLSVAYGIVQDHGGWIGVESARGAGSTFTVFLPTAQGDAEEGP